MKSNWLVVLIVVMLCSVASAQKSSTPKPVVPQVSDTSIILDESANLKADLAELRALLNVLASAQSSSDTRVNLALQTNRQMWQVIIGRLAELTKRIDAIEQQQHTGKPAPAKKP